MPNGDGTGPQGKSSLNGTGFGYCEGRFRRGFGFRPRHTSLLSLTKEEEKKILEAELKDIETEKELIQKKLNEL